MGHLTVGAAIDLAIQDVETQYVFSVVASKTRVLAVYLLSKENPISPDAVKHVDVLRNCLLADIPAAFDLSEATL